MIRTLLVDDEEPARERLRHLLDAHHEVEIIGEAADGEEAVSKIGKMRPDLVFLDIQMPVRNGMQVAASLAPPRPKIIFCTAFDQYAIDAFELNAVDYLLKPVNRKRLARTIERIGSTLRDEAGWHEEIASARAVQKRLFPSVPPPLKTLDYGGVCRPAKAVGGDYYDFLKLGSHQLGIALADVSGKGIYAGLLMANLQGCLQSQAPEKRESVAELMVQLNRRLWQATDADRYATLFYAVYDDQQRTFTYSNAGHHPPVWLRKRGEAAPLDVGGMPVGMFERSPYNEQTVQLAAGDLLLLFTDGIVEAASLGGEEFGRERLRETAASCRHLPARQLQQQILEAVDRFAANTPQQDDLTLVVMKVLEVE